MKNKECKMTLRTTKDYINNIRCNGGTYFNCTVFTSVYLIYPKEILHC